MAWHHELRAAMEALFFRRKQEAELAEELRHHLEMEQRFNLRDGLDVGASGERARRAFGSVERMKDDVRDERGASWYEHARQDARLALRSLARRPAFTALVIVTLGLGIGATTTLFGVVRAVLLAPLPYGQPEGVAVVWSAWRGFEQTWLSYDEYEAWDSQIKSFADVGIFADGSLMLTDGETPERVRSASVGANVFDVLGVQPMLGRGFTLEEDRPNGPRVVVLGHDLWQRRYEADPSIVGRAIQVNGEASTVVGVMAPGFRLPLDYGASGRTEAWMPLAATAEEEGAVPGPAFQHGGGSHGFYGVARLTPGATVAGANRDLAAFVARMVRENIYPKEMQFRAFARSVEDQVTGKIKPVVLVVFGAVGFVLLIACANVAGLLLVRGESRRREMAVRIALGAGGSRLTRLLLTESAVLAALGGTAGVVLAWAGVVGVRRLAPAALPRVGETQVEPALLVFALAITALVALLAGVLPALQARRVAPAGELKEGGRSATTGAARLRWRQLLVTAEVALAVVLVVGAGLMIRSVGNLFAIDPGFDPRGVLTMRVSTPSTWYGDSAAVERFWRDVQGKVAAAPNVRAVGAVRLLPLTDEMGDWGLRVEGYTPPPQQGTPGDWQVVTPGYFEAMGLRLVTGRFLDERDDLAGALAMVVNQEFVKRYISGRSPLGIKVGIGSDMVSEYAIAGVVDDVKHNALTREVKAQFYVTQAHFARSPGNLLRTMHLVTRTDGDPRALIGPVRAIVRETDPRLPVSSVRTMEEVVGASIAEPRFAMQLLSLFGVLALTLAAIGVFGIVSQVVVSRSQEFGIRTALGATPRELVFLSLRTGQRQVLVGLVVGAGAALLLTRSMTTLLQGVSPTDPLTFGGVVVLTGVIALLASLAPAARAARTNPASVLSAE